jgi:hypothetical protein
VGWRCSRCDTQHVCTLITPRAKTASNERGGHAPSLFREQSCRPRTVRAALPSPTFRQQHGGGMVSTVKRVNITRMEQYEGGGEEEQEGKETSHRFVTRRVEKLLSSMLVLSTTLCLRRHIGEQVTHGPRNHGCPQGQQWEDPPTKKTIIHHSECTTHPAGPPPTMITVVSVGVTAAPAPPPDAPASPPPRCMSAKLIAKI